MVKIAVAGGAGKIATKIIDKLVETRKHEILILSRKKPITVETRPGVTWLTADYTDKTALTSILAGVNTVLCFTSSYADINSVGQKTLIDASIAAGVKRFAPNEWGSATAEELPWYAEKINVQNYLKHLNKEKKVIEYTLFQPGMLLDMFAPDGTQELFIDFPRRRAIVIDGQESLLTATTTNDLANVVTLAIEYQGEWPVVGGVSGEKISTDKMLEIGQRVRGDKPWDITRLTEDFVRSEQFEAPWLPLFEGEDLTKEQMTAFSEVILKGSLLSALCQSWVVSDEWNRLLPDYRFESAEEFLQKIWAEEA